MIVVGAFVVRAAGATSFHCSGLVDTVLPGSKSRANAQEGSLGTWEVPLLSTPMYPARDKPVDQVPGPWMGHSGIHGSEAPELRGSGTVTPRQRSVREGCGKS